MKTKKQRSMRDRQFCPFELLRDYIKVRRARQTKSSTEQFFIFRDRSVVKPEHVRRVLKRALTLAGVNPQLYSCHEHQDRKSSRPV